MASVQNILSWIRRRSRRARQRQDTSDNYVPVPGSPLHCSSRSPTSNIRQCPASPASSSPLSGGSPVSLHTPLHGSPLHGCAVSERSTSDSSIGPSTSPDSNSDPNTVSRREPSGPCTGVITASRMRPAVTDLAARLSVCRTSMKLPPLPQGQSICQSLNPATNHRPQVPFMGVACIRTDSPAHIYEEIPPHLVSCSADTVTSPLVRETETTRHPLMTCTDATIHPLVDPLEISQCKNTPPGGGVNVTSLDFDQARDFGSFLVVPIRNHEKSDAESEPNNNECDSVPGFCNGNVESGVGQSIAELCMYPGSVSDTCRSHTDFCTYPGSSSGDSGVVDLSYNYHDISDVPSGEKNSRHQQQELYHPNQPHPHTQHSHYPCKSADSTQDVGTSHMSHASLHHPHIGNHHHNNHPHDNHLHDIHYHGTHDHGNHHHDSHKSVHHNHYNYQQTEDNHTNPHYPITDHPAGHSHCSQCRRPHGIFNGVSLSHLGAALAPEHLELQTYFDNHMLRKAVCAGEGENEVVGRGLILPNLTVFTEEIVAEEIVMNAQGGEMESGNGERDQVQSSCHDSCHGESSCNSCNHSENSCSETSHGGWVESHHSEDGSEHIASVATEATNMPCLVPKILAQPVDDSSNDTGNEYDLRSSDHSSASNSRPGSLAFDSGSSLYAGSMNSDRGGCVNTISGKDSSRSDYDLQESASLGEYNTGDLAPHYDYYLTKAQHNLWLKGDVMRVIRESESSEYETSSDVNSSPQRHRHQFEITPETSPRHCPKHADAISLTTVTSLSDLSLSDKERCLRERIGGGGDDNGKCKKCLCEECQHEKLQRRLRHKTKTKAKLLQSSRARSERRHQKEGDIKKESSSEASDVPAWERGPRPAGSQRDIKPASKRKTGMTRHTAELYHLPDFSPVSNESPVEEPERLSCRATSFTPSATPRFAQTPHQETSARRTSHTHTIPRQNRMLSDLMKLNHDRLLVLF